LSEARSSRWHVRSRNSGAREQRSPLDLAFSFALERVGAFAKHSSHVWTEPSPSPLCRARASLVLAPELGQRQVRSVPEPPGSSPDPIRLPRPDSCSAPA